MAKKIGKMSVLEHIMCALEDLNDERLLEDKEQAKLQIEKARTVSDLVESYTEVIKTEQRDKEIILSAMDIAGKWNYKKGEIPSLLGFDAPSEPTPAYLTKQD